jgi:hypothetical protein
MIKKSKVGWIIPTNNPKALFNYFLKSIDIILCDEFKLLIAFQPPWTSKLIDQFLSKCKMDVGYDFIEPKRPVSMMMLRNHCAMLDRSVDYYVLTDDNFLFTNGTPKYPADSLTRYQQVIQYMDEFQNCGYVMCEGSLGGSIQKLIIKPTLSGLVSTQRGVFFRNMKGRNVWPSDCLNIPGTCEETIVCYDIISKGFFPAKQFNNPTQHKDKIKVEPNKNIGTIHCLETLQNGAIKYIREKYKTDIWTNDTRFFPKELIKQYLKSGGDSEWLDSTSEKYAMDFENVRKYKSNNLF